MSETGGNPGDAANSNSSPQGLDRIAREAQVSRQQADNIHQETDSKSHFADGDQEVREDVSHRHKQELAQEQSGILPHALIAEASENQLQAKQHLESDKTTDKPPGPNATKQDWITYLEVQAHTRGTALYNAIKLYEKGVSENKSDGVPNEHDSSPHGFPETSVDRQHITGLQNSSEVRPGLYRGANPGGSGDGAPWSPDQLITNLVNLKYDKHVNTVVSLEEVDSSEEKDNAKPDHNVNGKIAAEQAVCDKLGLHFFNIPLDQSYHGQRLQDQATNFLGVVNKPGVVAYFHCREGIDRTGYMAAQAEMIPPVDANGINLYPAKSVQEAAQDQVNHGYGQEKRKDYTNFFLPGADYNQADANKNWTESEDNQDLSHAERFKKTIERLKEAAQDFQKSIKHPGR